MLNEDFEKQYKEYFDDFGERGFTLAWIYFVNSSIINVQDPYQISQPIILPSIDTIRNDVIEHIKNQKNAKELIELFHLFIKNMIIEDDLLNSINKKDNALISYLIINIIKPSTIDSNYYYHPENYVLKPTPDSKNKTISIPESNKYLNLNKSTRFIQPPNPKLIEIPNINHLTVIKQSDNIFDIFVFLLDKYGVILKNKTKYLLDLLSQYEIIKNNKKNYKWIDKNNPEQIQWTLNYLKDTLNLKLQINPIDYANIIERKCSHYEIIFLYLSELPITNKELMILKLKKAWSQQKFRMSGKAKKAYHLPLTKLTNKKLKALSEVMNKTESQILEMLIEEKYRIAILDENGKPKY